MKNDRPEISFYHLTTMVLEKALPKLMEKVLAGNMRALILAANEQRMEMLNACLWTYSTLTFLPHGSQKDAYPEEQPIYLSTTLENPNKATVLAITDDSVPASLDGFERCLYFFDGTDNAATATARKRWQDFKSAGHSVQYWKQNDKGAWEKAA